MIEGSTPTRPRHLRQVDPLPARDHDSTAPCTRTGTVHPVASNGRTICPACLPDTYASFHALHAGPWYATTEARAVTR